MEDDKLLNIDSLMNFGFIECGRWSLSDGGLKPNIFYKAVRKVIYAFATKTRVGYIGITDETLYHRLRKGYSPAVDAGIIDRINNGENVTILFFKPDKIKFDGIKIDLLRALEIPLQRKFKTQWTTMGYGGLKRILDPIVEGILDQISTEEKENKKENNL